MANTLSPAAGVGWLLSLGGCVTERAVEGGWHGRLPCNQRCAAVLPKIHTCMNLESLGRPTYACFPANFHSCTLAFLPTSSLHPVYV